jgi:hypothetical protein
MSSLFVVNLKKTPEASFLRDTDRLRTLVCMLGRPGHDVSDCPRETLLEIYRRGMERLADTRSDVPSALEDAIRTNWDSLTPFSEIPPGITRNAANNLTLPRWLLGYLCRPEWIDFQMDFARCFRDSPTGAGFNLKKMLNHQPCSFFYEPPRYNTFTELNMTTQLLLDNQRNYTFLAQKFLGDVRDWRSSALEWVIAALAVFKLRGGVLTGRMVYDMVTTLKDNTDLAFPYVPQLLGYLREAVAFADYMGLQDLECAGEYELQADWARRLPHPFWERSEIFETFRAWAYDVLVTGSAPKARPRRDASPVRPAPVQSSQVEEGEDELDGTVVAIRAFDVASGKEELAYVCLRRQPDATLKAQVFAPTKHLKSGSYYVLTLHMDDYEPESVLRLEVPWDGSDTLFIPKKDRTIHRRKFRKSEGSGEGSSSPVEA